MPLPHPDRGNHDCVSLLALACSGLTLTSHRKPPEEFFGGENRHPTSRKASRIAGDVEEDIGIEENAHDGLSAVFFPVMFHSDIVRGFAGGKFCNSSKLSRPFAGASALPRLRSLRRIPRLAEDELETVGHKIL